MAMALCAVCGAAATRPAAQPAPATAETSLLDDIRRHMGAGGLIVEAASPAAAIAAGGESGESGVGALLARIASSLVVVIALLVIVIVALKLARRDGVAAGGGLKVLSRAALSSKSSIILVDFFDRVLMLGDGEGGPRLLQVIDDPALVERLRRAAPAMASREAFSDQLRRLLGRGRDEAPAPSASARSTAQRARLDAELAASERAFRDMRETLRRSARP